ncbi:MAG: DegT/DnrJ/EryC1/StrS family aminotransferase, partial [Ghiorsea sp.]|nr:DegT/DnrJ/EryC1/StrS family aminotransferase [Ghiorsea sp.]
YDEAFKGSIVHPLYTFDGKSSYHLYVVQVNFEALNISKEDLFNLLRAENIGIQLHYIPINKQPYYKALGYGDEDTPVMDTYYKQCFSLPMYPKLSDEEQDVVVLKLLQILHG